MVNKVRAVIAAYVALGANLAAVGLLLSWSANLGVIAEDAVARLVTMVAGLVLVFVGIHIAVAGLRSLRHGG